MAVNSTHESIRSEPAAAASGLVYIVCPGALENGGGIGRQMGYFLEARKERRDGLTYEVVDSRGPWFLGAAPGQSFRAIGYLAAAAGKLVAGRLARRDVIAHINIAGRGSTVRKLGLVTLARLIGLRYLLHVHDPDYGEEYQRSHAARKWAIRGAFRGAEKVLVLGARDQKVVRDFTGLSADDVVVLHNAVPDPNPRASKARLPGEPCKILFLGHLSERKGVSVLLRALSTPALAALNWSATVAGGGPVEHYSAMAAELGLAARVEFPGWVERLQMNALSEDADILVLPSFAEGLAMSVLEGLSYGLAVVTTPVGAHLEVIEPERSGILVPAGDQDALAAALVRIITDKALRERLQAGARSRYLEKFDVRSYAQQLSAIHASLLVPAR